MSEADSCLVKTPYASKTAARKAIRGRRSRLDRLRGSPPLEPYRCPYCGLWHIGHRSGSVRRDLR